MVIWEEGAPTTRRVDQGTATGGAAGTNQACAVAVCGGLSKEPLLGKLASLAHEAAKQVRRRCPRGSESRPRDKYQGCRCRSAWSAVRARVGGEAGVGSLHGDAIRDAIWVVRAVF